MFRRFVEWLANSRIFPDCSNASRVINVDRSPRAPSRVLRAWPVPDASPRMTQSCVALAGTRASTIACCATSGLAPSATEIARGISKP